MDDTMPWEGGRSLRSLVEEFEKGLICSALSRTGWQQRRAASLLGVLPTTLNEKIKRMGIARSAEDRPGTETVVLDARERREFRWRSELPAGALLEVKGTRGRIRAQPADGPAAEVVAVRADSAGSGQVALSVLEHDTGAVLSIFSARPQGGPFDPDRRLPGSSRDRLEVDFEVRVPAGVRFAARLESGDIVIVGLADGVEAQTQSGGVRFAPRMALSA